MYCGRVCGEAGTERSSETMISFGARDKGHDLANVVCSMP
jgi:hypothetical protein